MKSTRIYLLFIFALFFAACEMKQKPVTKEEAAEFAKQVTKSLENDDPRFLNDAFDYKGFGRKMGKGASSRKVLETATRNLKLGDQIGAVVTKGGVYSLVRQYEKDGVQHLLFRLYQDGSLNYHDMELTRVNGKCKIADMYVYLSGENFSETLRNLYWTAYNEVGDDKEYDDKWVESIQKISKKIKSNDFEGAKELLATLPVNLRKQKVFQLLNIQALEHIESDEWMEAIENYKRSFPNEPNIPFLMINLHTVRKEYMLLRDDINALDKQLGTDPILDFYRANSYLLEGKNTECNQYLEKLIRNMPQFSDGLYTMVYSLLQTSDYEKARPYVDRLKAIPGYDQTELDNLLAMYPEYEE